MNYQLRLNKGSLNLDLEVLKTGLCCVCGGCLSLCPYFRVRKEEVVLFELCTLDKGRCYEICPRTEVQFEELNQAVFNEQRKDYVLGTHRAIYLSQSKDKEIQQKAQYGGTVSGLLTFALETEEIDGAVVSGNSETYPVLPEPVLAKTKEDILKSAGSKYSACPSLSIIDSAMNECKKLAFVGRPCQVISLRKRMIVEPEFRNNISLIIGLFCMWSLSYRELYKYLSSKIELRSAKKIDIPYNRFVVYTNEKAFELEFDQIKKMRRKTCDICYDFTSEFADLSVGSTEWKDEWNTLIVRTDKGEKLVNSAKVKGALNLEPFPKERERLLRIASLNKKKRVIGMFADERAKELNYLKLSDAEKEFIERANPQEEEKS